MITLILDELDWINLLIAVEFMINSTQLEKNGFTTINDTIGAVQCIKFIYIQQNENQHLSENRFFLEESLCCGWISGKYKRLKKPQNA